MDFQECFLRFAESLRNGSIFNTPPMGGSVFDKKNGAFKSGIRSAYTWLHITTSGKEIGEFSSGLDP
jgi:hypothetical protein